MSLQSAAILAQRELFYRWLTVTIMVYYHVPWETQFPKVTVTVKGRYHTLVLPLPQYHTFITVTTAPTPHLYRCYHCPNTTPWCYHCPNTTPLSLLPLPQMTITLCYCGQFFPLFTITMAHCFYSFLLR